MSTEVEKTERVEAPKNFLAITNSPTEWRVLAAALKVTSEDVTFRANESGLTLDALLSGNFRMLLVDWPASAFARYECPVPTEMTIEVGLLNAAILRAADKDSIELSITQAGLLKLKFIGEKKKEFEFHLGENKPPSKIMRVETTATIRLAPGVMEDAMADTVVIDDVFMLSMKEQGATFSVSEGAEVGHAKREILTGSPELLSVSPGADAKAKYSVEIVLPILKAFKPVITAKDGLKLSIGEHKPMRMDFDLNALGAKAVVWVAPRIAD